MNDIIKSWVAPCAVKWISTSTCKLHEWSIFFSYQNFDQSNKIVDSFQHLWLYGGVDLVYENYQIMV